VGKGCKRCPNGSFVAFDRAPGKYHRDCKSCPLGKTDYLDNLLSPLLYIELTISFLIGRKRRVNFRNQGLCRRLAADYVIIMSRTLKVTTNHADLITNKNHAVHDF